MADLMMKLYPPSIPPSIPAFYVDEEEEEAKITVPFSMNKAVSAGLVKGFGLKIKTVQSNRYITTLKVTNLEEVQTSIRERKVTFTIEHTNNDFFKQNYKIGQYFKVQLAYYGASDGENPGYFSTVATVKFTSKPNVLFQSGTITKGISEKLTNRTRTELWREYDTNHQEIILLISKGKNEDLSSELFYINSDDSLSQLFGKIAEGYNYFYREKNINISSPTDFFFYGFYYNKDSSELLYSYKFDLYDNSMNLIESSDWLLHNSTIKLLGNVIADNDIFIDRYSFQTSYIPEKKYYMKYTVRTINNLEVESELYLYIYEEEEEPNIDNLVLTARNDYDNGFIGLKLAADESQQNFGAGIYKILRTTIQTNQLGEQWELINIFYVSSLNIDKWSYKDFTIEQGNQYKYAIQKCTIENNNIIYYKKIISNQVYADFEDMFLYDGIRQLKIRFNPQMSSFKTTKLETKIDTIGSSYPFFFRNGNTNYKEFPISGLISYLSDEENYFINTISDLQLVNPSFLRRLGSPYATHGRQNYRDYPIPSTSLEGYNVYAERKFKLQVLDWLNDGQVKIFKSPTEGNYVVRLMNTSLAPNTTVGRMLHTFSSIAYEAAPFSHHSLLDLGFYASMFDLDSEIIQLYSIAIKDLVETKKLNLSQLTGYGYIEKELMDSEIDEDGNVHEQYSNKFTELAETRVWFLDGQSKKQFVSYYDDYDESKEYYIDFLGEEEDGYVRLNTDSIYQYVDIKYGPIDEQTAATRVKIYTGDSTSSLLEILHNDGPFEYSRYEVNETLPNIYINIEDYSQHPSDYDNMIITYMSKKIVSELGG